MQKLSFQGDADIFLWFALFLIRTVGRVSNAGDYMYAGCLAYSWSGRRLANAGGSAGLMLGLLVECPERTLQAHDKQLLVFALISYRSVQKTSVFVMVSGRSVRKT